MSKGDPRASCASGDRAPAGCTRRHFVATGLLTLATAGLASRLRRRGGTRKGRPPPDRPNIILAMTDDQGWADAGYMGHPHIKTPTLDEMAAAGLRFERFYAAATGSSPTRASCLTGRHPNRCGVLAEGCRLPTDEITLAEVLRDAGYATGHFGQWQLGPLTGPSPTRARTGRRGARRHRPPHPGGHGFEEWLSSPIPFDLDPPDFVRNGEPVGRLRGNGSDILVARAGAWIRRCVRRGRPFLAVLWFANPHRPHRALAKDRRPYRHLAPAMQHYLGEITAVDRAMRTLRQTLRRLGAAGNTLLWFTSDNGGVPPLAHHGDLRGGKGSLWEGGLRVPGLLEWPARITGPARTAVPAATSDFFPTILDLLGLESPDPDRPIDGISLVPVIEGTMQHRPAPIAFEVRNGTGRVPWAALTDDRWKLHVRGRTVELYDLAADPGERNDVAGDHTAVVSDMQHRVLEPWQRSVERSLAGADYHDNAKSCAAGLEHPPRHHAN